MLFVFMKCMYSCTIFIYAKAFVYVRHLWVALDFYKFDKNNTSCRCFTTCIIKNMQCSYPTPLPWYPVIKCNI